MGEGITLSELPHELPYNLTGLPDPFSQVLYPTYLMAGSGLAYVLIYEQKRGLDYGTEC